MPVNSRTKTIMMWVLAFAFLMFIWRSFTPQQGHMQPLSYSAFVSKVQAGDISRVTISGQLIEGQLASGGAFQTYLPMQDTKLLGLLADKKVQVTGKPPAKPSFFMQLLANMLPFVILILIYLYFMRQMQGGGKGGPMSFGRSKARLLGEDQVKVTFKDVAGVDEAKLEVQELVEFLRDPGKFQKLGGRIPTGVLLVGSPGTGKTLLAKAVAGEAKVPFFTISGSDFVEMFVGVGASRVRDMFEQAKKQAPCIIFIDEIDAVGRHRGAGLGGGHDEREQTLNQLLVEMDGFGGNEGVIVMAATNRPDVLDPALMRPGRFDRQVVVPLPDIKGREEILKVHISNRPVSDDVRPGVIARGTPGFSGADLANLVNEAALFAARAEQKLVRMEEFEKAKDKLIMGAERRSMVMNEDEKKLTAYHEAGHAIVGLKVEQHDPVYKVSIIPRGRALGVTMFLPEQDRYSYSKRRLLSQIASLFGGRLAEEMIFGADAVTTGASNDIERATELARNMVTKWGLSDRLGPLTYGEEEGEVFLGRSMTQQNKVSEATTELIDAEIRLIVDTAYAQAKSILEANMSILHAMADALMLYETIGEAQIEAIMKGQTPPAPEGWDDAVNQPPSSDTSASDKASAEPEVGSDKPDAPPSASAPAVSQAHKDAKEEASDKKEPTSNHDEKRSNPDTSS
jgi:cell division protease FtsH